MNKVMKLFTAAMLFILSTNAISQTAVNSITVPTNVSDWQYYSRVSKRTDEKKTFLFSYDSITRKRVSLKIVNLPIYMIISKAYDDLLPWNEAKIIIESNRKDQIIGSSSDDLWNYEIKVRPADYKNLYKYARQDLERYFGLTTSIEKRKVPSLVLVKIGSLDKVISYDTSSKGAFKGGKEGKVFKNAQMVALTTFIQMSSRKPVVDGTNFSQRVNLTIKANFSDIPALRKELQSYGLDIIEDEREVDMIVVKDEY